MHEIALDFSLQKKKNVISHAPIALPDVWHCKWFTVKILWPNTEKAKVKKGEIYMHKDCFFYQKYNDFPKNHSGQSS